MTSEAEFIQALKSEECTVIPEDSVLMISSFDIERVKRIFHQHGMSFAVRNSKVYEADKARLVWSCKDIEYFGTPFFVAKRTKLECINGTVRKPADKNSVQLDHSKKKRSRLQSTKKNNCPAIMKITEIVLHPEYSAEKRFSHILERRMRELRQAKKSTDDVLMERQYFITVSKPSEHNHSVKTSFMSQNLDPQLKAQIKTYVDDGVTNISTIKTLLETYVRENIKGNIPSDSRSFFPSKEIIYNYVLKYSCGFKANKIDEVALKSKIESWEKSVGGNFHLRFPSENNSQPFLFCYQAQWQQILMARYGSVVLLDSTYKTTKYNLPLFTLFVKTNCDYIIVGIFMVQCETASSIAEALNVFRVWNPDCVPQYFLTDFSEAEIDAVKSNFQCPIYFDDFHVERAWSKWLKKKGHVSHSKDSTKMLNYFRRLAKAKNGQDYSTAEDEMKKSVEWLRNELVQNYYNYTWHPVRNQWAHCFFDSQLSFVINANNGMESMHNALKHSYLQLHSDKSLCGILDLFIDSLFQDRIKVYQHNNSMLSAELRSSNEEIPNCLRVGPIVFYEHLYSRYKTSLSVYSKNMIAAVSIENQKCFLVQSEGSNHLYTVDLAVPSCSCDDFYKFRFPCEHMCALFAFIPGVTLDSLPSEYMNSPFMTIDSNFPVSEEIFWTEEVDSQCLWVEAKEELNNEEVNLDSPCSPEASHTVEIVATSNEIDLNFSQTKLTELREKAQNILDLTFLIPSEDHDLTHVDTFLTNAEQLLKRKLEDENDVALLPSKKSNH